MNIEDFVAETLSQITRGVVKAQTEVEATGALVNPLMKSISPDHSTGVPYLRGGQVVTAVEFDVAVTATEGKETRGGIGVVAGAITLGSAGKSGSSAGSESRIKFSIPLLLPVHNDPRNATQTA